MTPSGLGRTALFLVATVAASLAQAQQASGSKTSAAASSGATATQSAPKATDTKASDAQPVKTAAAQKPADPSAQLIRDARNAGFKPETIRGTLMFCRTARELGSNFPVRTCYDEDQVKIKIHEYQTERNELEAQHNLGLFTH